MMNSVFIASCISAMAMSSELLREKFLNWTDDSQDLQTAQQAIDDSDKDMIIAMMKKFELLENKMNDQENRTDGINQRLCDQEARTDNISSEVDVLNSK